MKEISKRDSILGLAGEVFVEGYCRKENLLYKKGSKEEDYNYGIDAYISDIPTDIKNSQYLFPCQINKEGFINTRHPYKTTSKATHFLFVNVDETGQGKFIEHISVKSKLIRDIVKDESNYYNLIEFLKQIDKQSYTIFGTNLDNASLKIKEKILSFCKEDVKVNYNNPISNHDISFKMKKEEKTESKLTIKSIQSIRDLIRERKEGTLIEEKSKEKYPIIKIRI